MKRPGLIPNNSMRRGLCALRKGMDMGAISNGFSLMGQSWRVLRADKELVLFPIISAAAGVLVMLSFAVPFAMMIPWDAFGQQSAHASQARFTLTIAHYALILSFYIVNFSVVNFFNSALAACVLERFRGGNPTIAYGIAEARKQLHNIIGWAVLSATVGMIIQAIQERVGLIGKIVTALIGVAWSIASYFVVPVLIAEKLGPIDALKRSGMLMTKTWGASLISNVGLGLAGFLGALAALLPMAGGIVLCVLASQHAKVDPVMLSLGIACIAISIILLMGLVLITSTLKLILNAALYHFAVQGHAPIGFDDDVLRQAFRTKKGK